MYVGLRRLECFEIDVFLMGWERDNVWIGMDWIRLSGVGC